MEQQNARQSSWHNGKTAVIEIEIEKSHVGSTQELYTQW